MSDLDKADADADAKADAKAPRVATRADVNDEDAANTVDFKNAANADWGAGLPFWLDDVHAFLAQLRGTPFRIGVGEESRVLWLLDRLRLSDAAPQSAEGLAHWLGPVCCTSARQQALFADALARWAREHGAAAPERGSAVTGAAQAKSLSAPVAAVQRAAIANRWLLRIGLAAMLLVIAGVIAGVIGQAWLYPRAVQSPVYPAPAPVSTVATPWTLGDVQRDARSLIRLAVPLLGLAAFLVWQRRRPQSLARRLVAAATPQRAVSLQAARRLLFTPGSLSHHFQALRRHHEVPSTRLDVARSLRATLRAGGAVQLQFATQRRLPDYLVMVDRVSVADHQGALADVLLRRFAEEQVPCSGYDFHGDPRRARALGVGGALSAGATGGSRGAGGVGKVADLADLAALHGEHPLILFTDAERFFIDDSEHTPAWVDQLLAWPLTVILTPKPRTEWAARERRLQALGFVVLPATPAGIAGLAALLNAGAVEPVRADAHTEIAAPAAHATQTAPADPLHELLTELLTDQPDRWMRQTAPSPDDVDALIAALQAGLGARGFELLGAIAVFPAVRVEVTLWLADALSQRDGAGAPGLDEDLFGRLARLPWLRRGRMPDWLRLALIEGLDAAREAEIRTLCLELLRPVEANAKGAPAPAGERGNFQLDIATGSQRTWLATLLAAIRQDEHSALRDTVFLGFVRGDLRAGSHSHPGRRKSVDPLALGTPGELNRLLRPLQIGALEWLAVATTALATALLWQYDAAIDALWGRVWDGLTLHLQFGATGLFALRSLAWVGIATALVLWQVAVLHDAPAPHLHLLRGARVAAPAATFVAALALPGTPAGFNAVALLVAAGATLLLTWLPPRPATSAALPAQLSALTRGGGWVLTSVGIASWLALFHGGYLMIWRLLVSGRVPTEWSAAAVLMVVVALLLAALAALALGRRLTLPLNVTLRCGASSMLAAGFGLALMLAPSLVPVVAFEYQLLGDALLLLASAWGAMLALWQCGRARASWVAALARLTMVLAVVEFGLRYAQMPRRLSDLLGGAGGIVPATEAEILTTLCLVAVFAVSVARRGLMKDATGQWSVPQDGQRVPVQSPRLRLLLASGVLLAPASGFVLLSRFQTGTEVSNVALPLQLPLLLLVLLVPALRIAAPELFNPLAMPAGVPVRPGPAPRWVAWACVPLLWLLTLSYDFGFGRFPQMNYLFVPLAAWWAARYGRAGWAPFVVGAAPLLILFDASRLSVGGGNPGLFIAALIVYRLVTDSAYRDATFNAARVGWRQGLYLLLVAALIVVVPGTGPLQIGGSLLPYLTLLLLLIGLAGLRSRQLPWVLTLGLAAGFVHRLALELLPLKVGFDPLFQQVWVHYSFSDPSVMVGALLALFGPAWLCRRVARLTAQEARSSEARWTTLWTLLHLLLGFAFVNVHFQVLFIFSTGDSNFVSVSPFGAPGLMVLAFLIGLFEGPAARARVGWMLALLGLVALGENSMFLADGNFSGVVVVPWLRYSVDVLEVAQGALVVACYVALGVQVGARGAIPLTNKVPSVEPVVAATLPQLRFAYMDIVLMAGAAVLLALVAADALYSL